MFFASCIILGTLYPATINLDFELPHPRILDASRLVYRVTDKFHIFNSYGLFRRMTGVEGREELIVQGSHDKKVWKDYEFFYKPGKLEDKPKWCAPHQPRLDWQVYFM